MQFARRAFLRALPGAAVTGHIAAKAALDGAIGQAVGIQGSALGQFGGGFPEACNPAPPDRGRVRDFFRKFGLPDFERERMWPETSVHALDPDIAAKRSWSMSVKILTQRQRNFEQRVGRQDRNWSYEDMREAFYKKNGFWFWW